MMAEDNANEHISDDRIEKRIIMERDYYQNDDFEDTVSTVSLVLKVPKDRVRAIAEKVLGSQNS